MPPPPEQCNLLHPLFEFSGARRSCQKSLRRRRERRQRYRQLQRQQQPQGNADGTPSRSSGDDGEAAAAGGSSKCSPVSEQRRLDSAAQGSVTWQSTVAGWAGQLPVTAIVLALPAASAAPEAAQSAAAPRPTVTSRQLDSWEHAAQLEAQPVSQAVSHRTTAHTPLPSVAQPPTRLLPAWQPATEQQAVFLGADPTLAPGQHQLQPQWQPAPPQWGQPSHYQLPPTPLPPPQGQPPLWQQQGGQGQTVQVMLQAAELGIAPQGQWDTVSSLLAPQPMQPAVAGPAAMPVTLAQFQQRPASVAHAQQSVNVAPAMPPAELASQRSAPLPQLGHLLAMQQGGPAPLLPAGLGYAAPGQQQQRLSHSHSCPSHLAALEVGAAACALKECTCLHLGYAVAAWLASRLLPLLLAHHTRASPAFSQLAEEAIPSEIELLQLSCELSCELGVL